MGKFQDLSGSRFGRLTVKHRTENSSTGHTRWLCVCDCGQERINSSYDLKTGKVVSCGCFHSESVTETNTTHGKSKSKLFHVWCSMRDRCRRKTCKAYKNYGGRGISVCDEWLDYEVFYRWAIENGYAEGLTIDRIDVNGNYEPSNCRWITKAAQASNTRKSIRIEYKGTAHTAIEWSRILGVNYTTLLKRIHAGWDVEDAFERPVGGGHR